jgi:hypothetical protein
MTTAVHPVWVAVSRRAVIAARTRPSRRDAARPAVSTGIVSGFPTGFRGIADVVTHRPPVGYPLGPLGAAVAECHRCPEVQMPPVLGGQGGGHLDPQPARRIDPDRFIAAGLARFPVRGQKHPGRIPARPPRHLGQPRRQHRLSGGQAGPQHRQPTGLGETFTGTAIPAPATTSAAGPPGEGGFTRAQRAPPFEHRHGPPQVVGVGGDATHTQLIGIFHRTGDRPFTLRPPPGMRSPIQPARPDPARQLRPIHPTQKHPHRSQARSLRPAQLNPRPDPHPRRRGRHHRLTDPPQPRTQPHTHIKTTDTDNNPPQATTQHTSTHHHPPMLTIRATAPTPRHRTYRGS